jgi:hypothetical protein
MGATRSQTKEGEVSSVVTEEAQVESRQYLRNEIKTEALATNRWTATLAPPPGWAGDGLQKNVRQS